MVKLVATYTIKIYCSVVLSTYIILFYQGIVSAYSDVQEFTNFPKMKETSQNCRRPKVGDGKQVQH